MLREGFALAHRRFNLIIIDALWKTVWLVVTLASLFIVFGRYLTTPPAEWPGMWPDTRGIAIASLVTLAALTFLLTIVETLLRTDAMDLLGTDLIRVTGVIGTLLLFESMIGASLLVAV